METFKRLKRFYWPFKGYFFISLSALFLVTGLTMIYPFALKVTIDEVIGAGRYEWVPWIALGFVLLMLVKSLAAFVQQFAGDLFGIRTVYEL
ncbi:MAG: ABC transporter ATP-binding protein, partial [Planifilum fimeticola]